MPAGLLFDSANLSIAGNSSVVGTFPLIYNITDAQGYFFEAGFDIIVSSEVLPVFEGVIADFSVRHDEVINQTVPTVHIDEVTNITYTIHGLPLGVVHNASQGTIQGNPTQYGNFTITVLGTDLSRSESNQASFSFVLTAIEPLALAAQLSDLTFKYSELSTSEPLPRGSGGIAPYSYELIGNDAIWLIV